MSRILSPEIIDPLLDTLRSPEATEDEKNMAALTLVDAVAPDILENLNALREENEVLKTQNREQSELLFEDVSLLSHWTTD